MNEKYEDVEIDNVSFTGNSMYIDWSSNSLGFGTIRLSGEAGFIRVTNESSSIQNKITIDSEFMSSEFTKAVLSKLVDYSNIAQ